MFDLFLYAHPASENFNYWYKVKHGNCGPVQSLDIERQLVARSPVFYRLEKVENGTMSVGYIRLKEFNALARKDLVTGAFLVI